MAGRMRLERAKRFPGRRASSISSGSETTSARLVLQLIAPHIGQTVCILSQASRHAWWNRCLQCVFVTSSPCLKLATGYSVIQMAQLSRSKSTIPGENGRLLMWDMRGRGLSPAWDTVTWRALTGCLRLRKRYARTAMQAIIHLGSEYAHTSTDPAVANITMFSATEFWGGDGEDTVGLSGELGGV